MIEGKAAVGTKFGSMVVAVSGGESIYLHIIVPDPYGTAFFFTAVTLEASDEIEDEEDLQEYVLASMPAVLNACCDKVSRVRYLYEFECVDKVDMSQPLESGDYYIAIEKEFDNGETALSIVGICDDGSSFLDETTVKSAYEKLDYHSYDNDLLPILEPDQITVTKFTVFRLRD